MSEVEFGIGLRRLDNVTEDARAAESLGYSYLRLVRINTLFSHSEKYGPSWVLPVIPVSARPAQPPLVSSGTDSRDE